jgi:hypothetical protein
MPGSNYIFQETSPSEFLFVTKHEFSFPFLRYRFEVFLKGFLAKTGGAG